ncbi:hypothetical protein GCM10009646_76610 [Streptomyces aureus]
MGANEAGRAGAISIAVVLMFGAGACMRSAPSAEGGKSSQTSQAPGSPSPSLSKGAESEAVAAYRAMWRDAAEASRTSDPKHPRLDDHAKGNALSLLRYMMEQNHKRGATGKGAASVAPIVVKSSKTKVELQDCVDGSKWVQAKPSSSSAGISGGRYRSEATVVFASGKWWVSELYNGEAGSCMD